jgi:hypothetical protein
VVCFFELTVPGGSPAFTVGLFVLRIGRPTINNKTKTKMKKIVIRNHRRRNDAKEILAGDVYIGRIDNSTGSVWSAGGSGVRGATLSAKIVALLPGISEEEVTAALLLEE